MMESRAKVLGHPIHPMLVVFPLGLLIAAVVFDVVFFVTADPTFARVAFWNIAFGIAGGLLAAVFGLWDFLAIPAGTRAKAIGLWHGAGNVVVVLLFAASFVLRFGTPDHVPGGGAFVLALAGLALGAVSGWLGGELVDRLGVGVDPGANLDAPSSLSGAPAGATAGTWSGVERRATLRKREV
jgi:uncharacterized membrane protein